MKPEAEAQLLRLLMEEEGPFTAAGPDPLPPTDCIGCGGTRKNSKGGPCYPCSMRAAADRPWRNFPGADI